jgi:antitoxin component of RelBE/YafQ-DinJ toxin-antitoxin module
MVRLASTKVTVAFRIEKKQRAEVDRIIELLGVSASDVYRLALDNCLDFLRKEVENARDGNG